MKCCSRNHVSRISALRGRPIAAGAVHLPIDVAGVDEDDLPVLGAALAGHADYLITGDKELLVLERYKNTEAILGTPPGRPGSRMNAI